MTILLKNWLQYASNLMCTVDVQRVRGVCALEISSYTIGTCVIPSVITQPITLFRSDMYRNTCKKICFVNVTDRTSVMLMVQNNTDGTFVKCILSCKLNRWEHADLIVAMVTWTAVQGSAYTHLQWSTPFFAIIHKRLNKSTGQPWLSGPRFFRFDWDH